MSVPPACIQSCARSLGLLGKTRSSAGPLASRSCGMQTQRLVDECHSSGVHNKHGLLARICISQLLSFDVWERRMMLAHKESSSTCPLACWACWAPSMMRTSLAVPSALTPSSSKSSRWSYKGFVVLASLEPGLDGLGGAEFIMPSNAADAAIEVDMP